MPPGKSHGPLVSFVEAQALIASRCSPLPAELLPLGEAHGRVLAAPVAAARELPASDISMMDGYALRAADSAQPLRVTRTVSAGDAPDARELPPGEAARIFTGAPLPPGADCVAMQEQCEREGEALRLRHAAKLGQHVRKRGEEMRAGDELIARGITLGPAALSLAAGAGAAQVAVHARPRVAILPTGDELIPLGGTPRPGQLTETNSIGLAQLVREAGGAPILLGIAKDEPRAIAEAIAQADAEIVLTTGGASVGDHDHAEAALALAGGEKLFHGVAIRPGKPVLFGVLPPRAQPPTPAGQGEIVLHPNNSRDRYLFGLPGNPAASLLGFELFVRPALRLLLGDSAWPRPLARARLALGALARVPGLTFFPRGRARFVQGELQFTPSAAQSSMQIGSWHAANALAVLEPGEGQLLPGDPLTLLLIGMPYADVQ